MCKEEKKKCSQAYFQFNPIPIQHRSLIVAVYYFNSPLNCKSKYFSCSKMKNVFFFRWYAPCNIVTRRIWIQSTEHMQFNQDYGSEKLVSDCSLFIQPNL